MAEKTLITKVKLKTATTAEWAAANPVLLKGEVGFEITDEGKKKMKVGDGTTAWAGLDYFVSGDEHSTLVFEVVPTEAETDAEAIARVVGAAEIAEGDVAYVKRALAGGKFSYTAYVYNGTDWAAMDGNYSAENVYFQDDLTYTAPIGVKTVPASGSGTITASGKNVAEVLASILAEEENPTITQPTATLNSNNIGAKEVGTNIAINYAFVTTPGAYSYGPATEVTFSNYSATLGTETKDGASGTFTSIQVTDSTNLTISGSVTSTDGTIPKTNLGNDYAAGKITGKTFNPTKGTLSGFRGWFYGYKTGANKLDVAALTSDEIRGLGSGAKTSIPAQMSCTNMQQMFFAIPKGLKNTITVADAVNGAPQTVTKITDVMVEGANNFEAKAYDVWYVNNATAVSGDSKYNVVVK